MAVLDPVVEQLRAVQRRQLVVERGGRVVGVTHAALRAHIATRSEIACHCLLLESRKCTVGDDGIIGDLSSETISAHFQGLPANALIAATTWSAQI